MPVPLLALLAAGQLAAASPSEACARAAAVAEQRWGLPANLLLAIGRVESGRRDPASGGVQPWPWSADVAGQDYVFASAAEARTVVGYLQDRGIASIDVGCFQVNLHYHPGAFASVAEGFDPVANADYAGRFLRSLYQRSGSWEAAVADYHSADPVLGAEYRDKVLRAWTATASWAPETGPAPSEPAPAADPHVILISAEASAIPVYSAQTLPQALRSALGLSAARPSRQR